MVITRTKSVSSSTCNGKQRPIVAGVPEYYKKSDELQATRDTPGTLGLTEDTVVVRRLDVRAHHSDPALQERKVAREWGCIWNDEHNLRESPILL